MNSTDMAATTAGHPTDMPPGLILGTLSRPEDIADRQDLRSEVGQPTVSPTDNPSDWLPMTEACQVAGVTRRTLRRWVSAGQVESRLEGKGGAQVRWIRMDTLPRPEDSPADRPTDRPTDKPTDTMTTDPGTTQGQRPADTPVQPTDRSSDTSHGLNASLQAERDRLANEVEWLRLQVEDMRSAEREMRLLLARALPEPKMMPALEANITPPPRRRLKWWPFSRRER